MLEPQYIVQTQSQFHFIFPKIAADTGFWVSFRRQSHLVWLGCLIGTFYQDQLAGN